MGRLKIIWVRFGTRFGTLGGSIILKREFSRGVGGKAQIYFVTHEVIFKWNRIFGVKAIPLHLVKAAWAWKQDTVATLYSMLRTLFHLFKGEYHIVAARSHYLHDVLPAVWIKLQTRARLTVYVFSLVIPKLGGWSLSDWLLVLVQHFLSVLLMKMFADLIFVFNAHDRVMLERLGIRSEKIRFTYGGVDLDEINSVPECEKKEYEAVYFGRLSRSKGVYDLLETWKYVTETKPDAKLLMFCSGTDEEFREMRERITRLSLEKNIVLRGPLFGEEKYRMIKSSKLYVNPSYVDSWCLAATEAAACRTPVVMYYLSTYESIYGDAIVMAKTGDKRDLATKILHLLINEEQRRRKAEEAYEQVKQYTWKRAVSQELAVLTDLSFGGGKKVQS